MKELLIKKYYKTLKDLFIYFLSDSDSFPYIGWMDFYKIVKAVIFLVSLIKYTLVKN